MADQSAIEWTEATWNPVTGCDRVSPGCAHCYALDLAARLKRMGNRRYQNDGDPKSSGPGFGVTLHKDVLEKPLRWRRPRRIFVNSMSDLFHEEVPDSYIAKVFAVMALAPQHTFQVLTKRPERMRDFFTRVPEEDVGWAPGAFATWAIRDQLEAVSLDARLDVDLWALVDDPSRLDLPLPNVWLGVSIENRRFVHRADLLRDTPAAVRFISAEPLLGPLGSWGPCEDRAYTACNCWDQPHCPEPRWTGLDLTDIDWLIAGGESGPKHRRVDEHWVRDLRDAAWSSGSAFFFKQWGGRTPKAGGRELDGRTWDEFPDLTSQRAA